MLSKRVLSPGLKLRCFIDYPSHLHGITCKDCPVDEFNLSVSFSHSLHKCIFDPLFPLHRCHFQGKYGNLLWEDYQGNQTVFEVAGVWAEIPLT